MDGKTAFTDWRASAQFSRKPTSGRDFRAFARSEVIAPAFGPLRRLAAISRTGGEISVGPTP